MTRRKVHEISPISATASARRVDVGQTNSIPSDPDGRWIAKPQGAINEAFEKRGCLQNSKPVGAKIVSRAIPQDDACTKLSGGSDRIGRFDWDDTTPFGRHICFL